MSDATEIRMGLLRRRVSIEAFAIQCGLSVNALREMLDGGELSGEVLSCYAALEVGGVGEKQVEDVPKKEVEVEQEDELGEVCKNIDEWEPMEEVTCVFGRPCRNDRIQIIVFSDGRRDGMIRKKKEFRPRHGLPCEVRESADAGWLELVGNYRNNGVRLD